MSVSKLTNAEARRLLDMTKRSLIAELNFPTRGDEKEFDVVGDTKKDIFIRKIKPKSDYPLKTLYPRAFQTGQNHLIYYDFTTVE